MSRAIRKMSAIFFNGIAFWIFLAEAILELVGGSIFYMLYGVTNRLDHQEGKNLYEDCSHIRKEVNKMSHRL